MSSHYESPEIDLILLNCSDVITSSGIDEDYGENDGEWI